MIRGLRAILWVCLKRWLKLERPIVRAVEIDEVNPTVKSLPTVEVDGVNPTVKSLPPLDGSDKITVNELSPLVLLQTNLILPSVSVPAPSQAKDADHIFQLPRIHVINRISPRINQLLSAPLPCCYSINFPRPWTNLILPLAPALPRTKDVNLIIPQLSRTHMLKIEDLGFISAKIRTQGGLTFEGRKAIRYGYSPEKLRSKWEPPAKSELSESQVLLRRDIFLSLAPPLKDLLKRSLSWIHELYDFQIKGVEFLAYRKHALLADQMGLGKTVQAISALRVLFSVGAIQRALIVCPASLVTNWAKELEKWMPEAITQKVIGNKLKRRMLWRNPAHVYVTSYDSLRSDLEIIRNVRFDVVILDEAQKIKNPDTKTARALRKLRRIGAWGLSGTPLENKREELISIFQFIHPGLNLDLYLPIPLLREKIAPYFLRRRKEEVLKELPPKIRSEVWLELTPEQRKEYEETLEEERRNLVELASRRELTRPHIFSVIHKLKQICNHDSRMQSSCKLDYLKEFLQKIVENGDKVIVVTQYVNTTLKFLEANLKEYNPLIYHGSLSSREKERVIDEFQNSPDRYLLLMSLKAGGLGLNLQVASYLYLFDSWWNPAVEEQAEDRVHRIGQRKPVLVLKLLTEGTIEERIQEVLERKRRLFEEVVERIIPDGIEKLSPEELFEILDLDPKLAKLLKEGESKKGGDPHA